jgi:hypothetical protein
MFRLASMMATTALLLCADASGLISFPRPHQPVHFTPDENLPGVQEIVRADDKGQPARSDSSDKAGPPAKVQNIPLQPMTRLSLVRYVDGEFARVVNPIPAGKKGFHLKAGAPFDEKALRMALASHGSAINPGDQAQITDLQFKDRQIVVDINGGGRGKTRLRDRIHLEVGGMPTMTTTGPETPVNINVGATIYLDFDRPLPEMTSDDLKHYLSGLLDFSKQHSAAVQWVDTLPPEVQKAIEDKRAVVGMDHEMVLAAIGRPDHKVREKGPDGSELEDWIYGQPPAKTIFVVFEGDKVTKVEQFPK